MFDYYFKNLKPICFAFLIVLLGQFSYGAEDVQEPTDLCPSSECPVPNTQCPTGCSSCESLYKCTTCSFGYFLYHTLDPYIVICLECPFSAEWKSDFSSDQTLECADCIQNPHLWEFTRQCQKSAVYSQTSQYSIPNSDPEYQIYLIKYDSINKSYSTIVIKGCSMLQSSDFQNYELQGLYFYINLEVPSRDTNPGSQISSTNSSSQNSTSNSSDPSNQSSNDSQDSEQWLFEEKTEESTQEIGVSIQDNIDFSEYDNSQEDEELAEFNRCVKAHLGYLLDIKTQKISACPNGCKVCRFHPDGVNLLCQVCLPGWAHNIDLTCTECSSISNCVECSYGILDQFWGKLLDSENVNIYNQFLEYGQESSNSIQEYYINQFGLDMTTKQLWCFKCTSLYTPSVLLYSCESCQTLMGPSNCLKCDYYYSLDAEKDIRRYIEFPDSSPDLYQQCQMCSEGMHLIEDGISCSNCNTDISNCQQCYRGSSTSNLHTFPELSPYWPQASFQKTTTVLNTYCLACDDGYEVSSDGLNCTTYTPLAGCISQTNIGGVTKCIQCQDTFVLNIDDGTCDITKSCQSVLSNALCKRCYSHQIDGFFEYTCTSCKQGYMATFQGCQQCGNPICTSCHLINDYGVKLSEYIKYFKPPYDESMKSEFINDSNYFQILQTPYCFEFNSSPINANNQYTLQDGDLKTCLKFDQCLCQQTSDLENVQCKDCAQISNLVSTDGYYSIAENRIECIECPKYCIFCQDRDPQDTTAINPLFDFKGKYSHYSRVCNRKVNTHDVWNSEFSRFMTCQNGSNSCKQKYTEIVYISCSKPDALSLHNGFDTYVSLKEAVKKQKSILSTQSNFETPNLLQQFNQELYTDFEVQYIIITENTEAEEYPEPGSGDQMTECFFEDFTFMTGIPKNVFATKNVKIVFNTISTPNGDLGVNPANFIFNGNFTIDSFNSVQFNNIFFSVHPTYLRSLEYTIRVRNVFSSLSFELNRCILGWRNNKTQDKTDPTNTKNYLTFELENTEKLILKDVVIQKLMYGPNSSPFSYLYNQFSKVMQFEQEVENLTLLENFFNQSIVFKTPLIFSTFTFSGVKLIYNQFINGAIFLSDQQIIYEPRLFLRPSINLQIKFLDFKQNYIEDSQFLDMKRLRNATGQNFTSSGDRFQSMLKSFPLFSANTFILKNIDISEGVIFEQMVFFGNPKQTSLNMKSKDQNLTFSNLNANNVKCVSTIPCFFDFITPSSTIDDVQGIKVSLTNMNFKQINELGDDQMNITQVIQFRQINEGNQLIRIRDAYFVYLKEVNFIDNSEITMIETQNIENLFWIDSLCSFTKENSNATEFKTNMQNSSYILGSSNISESHEENYQGVLFQRASHCLKSQNNLDALLLRNITVQWIFSADNSLFHIQHRNQDVKFKFFPFLSFDFQNMVFRNNLMAITEKYSQIAPIYIYSDRDATIQFYNVTYLNTYLHTFESMSTLYPSTSNFFIDAFLSDVNITNCAFQNSSSYNNFNGIVIFSDNIFVQNSTFQGANLLGLENSFLHTSTLGAFGYLKYMNILKISQNVIVENGFSAQGGGFYVVPFGITISYITNVTFNNLHTSLNASNQAFGGALNIDFTSGTNTLFRFLNCSFENTSARTSGGAIYMQGSTAQTIIRIDQSQFINSNSIKGAAIFIEFTNQRYAELQINNTIFKTTSKELTTSFFSQTKQGMTSIYLQDIDTQEIVGENSFFHIKGVTLQTNQTLINSIFFYRLVNLALSEWIDDSSQILNIQRYISEVVKSYSSSIQFLNSTFGNISNSEIGGIQSDCELETPDKEEFYQKNPLCLLRSKSPVATSIILLQRTDQMASIQSSLFFSNTCLMCEKGLIYILKAPKINILNNRFENNTIESGTLIIEKQISKTQVSQTNISSSNSNRVLSNQTNSVPGMSFDGYMNFQVNGNTLANNTAIRNGAGFIILNQEMVLNGNSFTGNIAGGIGSGIIAENAFFEIQNSSFQNNHAFTGGALRVVGFYLLNGTRLSSSELNQYLINDAQFSNNTSIHGANDLVTSCVLGEFYENGVCVECPADSFNLQISEKPICTACPSERAICPGSFYLDVKPGYWRPDLLNSQIEKCYNLASNCIGGIKKKDILKTIVGDDLCSLGHVGALCEVCDLYNQRGQGVFAVEGNFVCTNCDELTGPNVAIITVISVLSLAFIIFSIRSTMIVNEEIVQVVILEKFIQTDEGALYIQIFTNYMQIISTIFTFNLSIPSDVGTAVQIAGTPIKKAIFSMDCFLIDISNAIGVSILYMRLIWTFMIPISYFLFEICGYLFYQFIKREKYKLEVITTGLLFLYIFYQPSIILNFVGAISCRSISGQKYIMGQVDKECGTDQYIWWSISFVGPILIIFSFLIPSYLFRILFKKRNELKTPENRRQLGILYNEYNPQAYFWEILRITEKTFIIIFVNFFSQDDVTKGCLIFTMIMFYTVLSLRFKPYIQSRLNQLDLQSSLVMGISIILAILASANSSKPDNLWLFILAMLILFVINVRLVLVMLREIILGQIDELGPKGEPIQAKCHKFCPCMRPYIYVKKTQPGKVKALWAMIANYFADFRIRKRQFGLAMFFAHSKGKLDWKDFVQIEPVDQKKSKKDKQKEKEKAKLNPKIIPVQIDEEEDFDKANDNRSQTNSSKQFLKVINSNGTFRKVQPMEDLEENAELNHVGNSQMLTPIANQNDENTKN